MANNDLALYGAGTGRSLRALWMLEELGLAYDHVPVGPRTGETMTEWFLKLNPKHKVPVLRHGGLVLSESAAIITYLSETFDPPAGFYVPGDPASRSRLNEWCFFIMTEMDAHSLYLVRRHTDLAHIYGEAPDAVASAKEYFLEQIKALLAKFPEDQAYLMGDQITVADILFSTCVEWAQGCGIRLPDRLGDYYRRLSERPAYRRAERACFPDRAAAVAV